MARAAVPALILAAALAGAGCALVPDATDDSVTFTVDSSAMEPALHCARPAAGCESATADRVRVSRTAPVERGDIVVFRTPPRARAQCGAGGIFIMRIVGLPGDRWSEQSGVIQIDERPLHEPYVRPEKRGSDTLPARVIPPRSFLALGDARIHACDSRRWGYVPAQNIIGPVVAIDRH